MDLGWNIPRMREKRSYSPGPLVQTMSKALGSNSPRTLLLPNSGLELGSRSWSGQLFPLSAFTPQFRAGIWE